MFQSASVCIETNMRVCTERNDMKGKVQAYCKRPRRVSCCSPAPSSVEPKSFIRHDPEHSSSSKGVRVRLSLDLENVERQEDDLADANYAGTTPSSADLLTRTFASSGSDGLTLTSPLSHA